MTFDLDYNWLAVIVAIIANMVLGAAWYGLWAKPWMKLAGFGRKTRAEMQRGATPGYLIALTGSLLKAVVLAALVLNLGLTSAGDGLVLGLSLGLGLVATTFAATYAFANKPLALFLIDAGYPILALAVMGAILGAWQ